jgi:citrate lyase subunit beta/citryl-CoA lyase
MSDIPVPPRSRYDVHEDRGIHQSEIRRVEVRRRFPGAAADDAALGYIQHTTHRPAGMARRSLLFSPGDRPEMMRKAPSIDADILVFDLEDAVAPSMKAEAREMVREALADVAPDAELLVRVNAGETALEDLSVVRSGEGDVDGIMLPKVRSAADVDQVAEYLAETGGERPVFPIIENAAGVLASAEVARAEATDVVCFGAEDLAADLGARRTKEGKEVFYARQRTLLAARAAGADVLDTVFADIEDLDGLREDAEFARQMGFDGKAAIHPAQVEVINDAFTPADSEVEWARKVLDAVGDVEDAGVVRVDGEMIDGPLIAQAERIRDRAGEKW